MQMPPTKLFLKQYNEIETRGFNLLLECCLEQLADN